MADNYVHFHSSPPINRLSYVRASAPFLNVALTHPRALFLPFHSGRPLLHSTPPQPAYLPHSSIASLLGPAPYFQQGPKPGETAPEDKWTEGCRFKDRGVPLVFLGVKEDPGAAMLPSHQVKQISTHEEIHGVPYWAVDMSGLEDDAWMQGVLEGGTWTESRAATAGYSHFDAATFSVARSMIDWNARNSFCPGCGSPVYSKWGGWKLACSTLLPWSENKTPLNGKPCPSGKGLHNFAHPRTDAVIIVAVVRKSPNGDGEDILLGRQKSWPKGMYSTLAGFLEPGESFEDAVRREIMEESGILVSRVRYHSSQPWPYPANLMTGCYAEAVLPADADYSDPRAGVRLDLDNELEDARWFTRAEIRQVLGDPNGTVIRSSEVKGFEPEEVEKAKEKAKLAAALAPSEGKVIEKPGSEEGIKVRVPPRTAIAGVLISEWANGTLKGNL